MPLYDEEGVKMMAEPFSVRNDAALMMEPVAAGDKIILSGISLRTGGTSHGPFASLNLGLHVGDCSENVVENRRIVAEKIGLPLDHWVCAEQVHGTAIARVTEELAGAGATSLATAVKSVDGLFTTEAGLLLALCFADCVPVYYYVKRPAAVGLMHCGWRGTVGGGAARMVETLCVALHVSPQDVHTIIGPAISGPDYEVDQKVIDEVSRLDRPVWDQSVISHGDGHYLLDLQALNRAILIEAGIPEKQIQVTGYSTGANSELFYSFRRDRGRTGRMMGFIGIKNEGDR